MSGSDAVIAVRSETFDAGEFREPSRGTASGENRHHADGFGDQRLGDSDDGFLDELFEAAQRAERSAGVDRADAAGMAGAPGLQEIERL